MEGSERKGRGMRTTVVALGMAALLLMSAGPLGAEEPSREDLERQNAELQGEVDRLKARVAELSQRLLDIQLEKTAFLVSTREGVVRVTPDGEVRPVLAQNGRPLRGKLSRYGDDVYCRAWRTVHRLKADGSPVASWKLSEDVVGHAFAALPDRRLAVFDNEADRIFVVDRIGRVVKELPMRDEPDEGMQSTFGLVVGDRLLVSEDGDKRILAVDLKTYEVEVFRDLGMLRSWIGAIGHANGTWYVCTGIHVYAFQGDEPHRLVAQLPKGNITGLAILGGQAFVTVNFPGTLVRIDLETGDTTTVASGLARPDGLVPITR